ncbi:elongation factor P 5-aminopentanone reductase [Psychrobacillus sp. FJAT-21963]|uniref:elongation factor P 5-aminopentanone reductase n=1 Tax=Psychrobacillus sp. FJAT-21963 TaxID=1712028 RepID=UPI0006F5F0EE|nr:SDR family oxidoreductase [Psychrobacillus sp. FJAT-21963]KQL35573.1 3-ketoacyl-ACP synthase [Psychrobacillus sp. FJAT-21963]
MTNKFALVVGASGEIGHAISYKLAEAGWSLYLHFASNEELVKSLLAKLESSYPEQDFLLVQADMRSSESVESLVSSIFSLQSIIFAQGHSLYKGLEETTLVEIRDLFQVHVEHPIYLAGKLTPKLRKNVNASIVFVGSIWGDTGASYEVAYSAAKGAQHAFVKAYAKEVALQKITVNAVAPGFIDTKMNHHLDMEARDLLLEEIPAGVFGTTDDVANAVEFLVSEKANYITGQIIRVNGGWYI